MEKNNDVFISVNERICFSCGAIINRDDYQRTNAEEDPFFLHRLWWDERVELLCCECVSVLKRWCSEIKLEPCMTCRDDCGHIFINDRDVYKKNIECLLEKELIF